MKKMIFFSAIMLLSLFALAQKKSESSIAFGIKGGVTFNKFSLSGNNTVGYTASSITSFYVGATVDIPVFSVLSVQPGLLFIGKGGNTQFPFVPPASINTKYSPFYLEIPVNLMAEFELGPGQIFMGAGPYLSFGIRGKIKETSVDQSGVFQTIKDTSMQFGSNTSNDLKRTDLGLGLLLGYQLDNGINIHGGYSFSLSNINPDASAPTLKNNVLSIGLGYSF